MQRLLPAALVLALLVPSAAVAAEPSARQSATANVQVGDYFFRPSFTRIEPGDSVTWAFGGADVHNVTAQVTSPERFGSADRTPGQIYTRAFPNAGRFPYICTIHEEMRGVVQVGPDVVDPRLTRIKAKVGKKAVRVSFRLSETAKVSAFVTKVGQKKKLRRVKAKRFEDGGDAISIRRKGLAAGRYRVTLTARDAEGNAGVARVRFKLSAR